MAVIAGQVTLDSIRLLDVDTDPAISGGTPGNIGDIAIADSGQLYINRDGSATNWRKVIQQSTNTAFTAGSITFIDSAGDLAEANSQLFWDSVNNRFGLGISSPQSKLHIDGGTGVASGIRWTAGTTTGQTATDGMRIGIDASGNGEVRQYENLPLTFYTNNLQRLQITAAGLGVFSDAVRVGNTADTTNGNIWYDGTDIYGRVSGANLSLTATPSYFDATDTNTTTTSLTFVPMTGMNRTPPAGTYLVSFASPVSNTNGGKAVEVKLMIDGTTDVVGTLRHQESNPGGSIYSVHFEARVTVNGSQNIGVYWRVDANTGTAYARSLSMLKVQPL